MLSAPNSTLCRKLGASVLLALTLISSTGALSTCGRGGADRVLTRQLPERPDWTEPVAARRPPDNSDWELVAKAQETAALANAGRLRQFGAWYDERRTEFSGSGAMR